MLVLTRKTQQQIQIGDNIRITILQVKGGAVRVGIEAPKNVDVMRTELVKRIEAEMRLTAEKVVTSVDCQPAETAQATMNVAVRPMGQQSTGGLRDLVRQRNVRGMNTTGNATSISSAMVSV